MYRKAHVVGAAHLRIIGRNIDLWQCLDNHLHRIPSFTSLGVDQFIGNIERGARG